jgi:O-antigen/teichoic acid export membrane protein
MITNTISILFVKGLSISARIILLLFLAKFTSPDEFGIISLMVAAAEILKFVADFGIDTLSIRDFAISPDRKTREILASNIALIKVIFSLIIYGLMVLTVWVSKYKAYIVIGLLSGILIFTTLWSNLSINYFQSQLKMNKLILPTFFVSSLSFCLMLSGVFFKVNSIILFSVIPFSELIATLLLYIYLSKELNLSFSSLSFTRIKNLLQKSFPIALTSIAVVVYTRLDIFVLGNFSNTTEIGFYSVAYRITEPFLFIASAFSLSIYSDISSRLAQKQIHIFPLIKKYIIQTSSYSICICISLIFIAPLLMKSMLPQYLPSLPVLNILAIALVFRINNNCFGGIFNAYGKYTQVTFLSLWNLILICLLVTVSIHQTSAVRTASILAFTEFINMVICIFLVRRLFLGSFK